VLSLPYFFRRNAVQGPELIHGVVFVKRVFARCVPFSRSPWKKWPSLWLGLPLLSGLLGACASDAVEQATPRRITEESVEQRPVNSDAGVACEMTRREVPVQVSIHVAEGSEVEYASNPPASGSHYPIWAQFGAYDATIPRGYWVHNLEHGSVVFLNGPSAAAADRTTFLKTFFDVQTDHCSPPRFLLTDDPLIETAFAVVAWGQILEGDCVSPEAIAAFAAERVGQGTEEVCSNGQYVPQ
jgi:hypothetical protein